MFYSVTYTDKNGASHVIEIEASSEVEVRQKLRRQGISSQRATITEKKIKSDLSGKRDEARKERDAKRIYDDIEAYSHLGKEMSPE